jgi:hypothetical protein
MTTGCESERLRAEQRDGRWWLAGPGAGELEVVNDFLGYLSDRGYSPRTVRSYAYDLLAFGRWLAGERLGLAEVRTDVLLRFLTFCRSARLPNQPGGNVVSIRSGRATGYAPATVNRRMAAISGLFGYWQMRDPTAVNPVPRRRDAPRRGRGTQRAAGPSGHSTEKPVTAAGPRAAAPSARVGPRRGDRLDRQPAHRPGPGDRRVDVVLRAALGRGSHLGRPRRRHPPRLGQGDRQG